MSVTLSLTQKITATLADGSKLDLGDISTPYTIALTTGLRYDANAVIADDYGTDIMWVAGAGGFDTWEVALIYSDADIFVEFRNLKTTGEYAMFKLQGGVWHVFSADELSAGTTGMIDGAVMSGGVTGDFHTCDEIAVQNNVAADAGDANVHLILLQ